VRARIPCGAGHKPHLGAACAGDPNGSCTTIHYKSATRAHDLEIRQRAYEEAEFALRERLEWVRKVEADLEASTAWARKTEAELEERTQWALDLKREKETALADFERGAAEAAHARRHIESLEKDLGEARAARARLEAKFWTRAGRKLGAV